MRFANIYLFTFLLPLVSLCVGCGEKATGDVKPQAIITTVPFHFADASSSIPKPKRYGNYGATWGDFNNDSRVDLIFSGHGSKPHLLAQGDGDSFLNVTKESGIKTSKWTYPQQSDRHGVSCSDFDNDGNLDLYISHGAKRGDTLGLKYDELLRGNGDFTFSDITHSAGTLNQQGRGRSGLWFDYNNDGWVDLYALNYRSKNVMYRNNGDSTFTDVTAEAGLNTSRAHAVPADVDQDGDIDLILAWPLKYLRNDGSGRFLEVESPQFKYRGKFGYGLALGDADNDGDLDIFVSRLENESMLLINDNGVFRRLKDRVWDINDEAISTGVSWGDIDNDGLLDLVAARSSGYFVYHNRGDLQFSSVKIDAPAPSIMKEKNGDIALADYNNDGLLDIVSDNVKGHILLRNENFSSNNWLKLRFKGTKNNRLGIGNKIWVTSKDELIAYREYTGSSGGLRSASCNGLHIGLALNREVDIQVQWLNGDVSSLKNVSANQSLTISETQ
ncbi:MAG: CRTAC1 family protein [Halioglobus sp.]